MKKYHLICAAVAVLGASASPLHANKEKVPEINKDWVGTWKLDPAQTKYGFTVAYSESKSKPKTIHAVSALFDYDYAFDGKDHKNRIRPTDTRSIAPAGESAWEGVQKVGGKAFFKYRIELSADGQTLEFKVKGMDIDIPIYSAVETYTRVTGQKGLIGKWRLIKRTPTREQTFTNTIPAPGVFRWESSENISWEGKVNGKDAPFKGNNIPTENTYSLRETGPRSLSETNKVNGKIVQLGKLTLSKDGKSYISEMWVPGHEDEKDVFVYVKQ